MSDSEPKRKMPRKTDRNLSRIADLMLIAEARRGNRAAFAELVYGYDQAVLRIAFQLTGSENEAKKIYREAFLRAYRAIESFDFECSFCVWIHRIVANICIDYLCEGRVREREAPSASDSNSAEFDCLLPEADTVAAAASESDQRRREANGRINHALQRFTPVERMVFELKHCQGMSLRTASEILNIGEDAAKSSLVSATGKLRAVLADEDSISREEGLPVC